MSDDGIYQNVDGGVSSNDGHTGGGNGSQIFNGLKLSEQVIAPRCDSTKLMLIATCFILLCGIVVLGVLYGNKEKNQQPQQATLIKAEANKTGALGPKKKFYLFFESLDWTESRRMCISAGGDMATVDNEEDQLLLLNLINNTNTFPFWIGLTDLKKEGQWLWSDGKPLKDNLTFWDKDQPDDGPDKKYAAGQDCVWIQDVHKINNWMDGYCNHLHGRICAFFC
ncbi:C-type lectin lectoxin-Lio3-like [Alosa pseudoharengus]|uniref:C-type lectin lectoxin-Lio3-like n=1 Tax=Alosa pseudoharengus TaxID=34774 RepID=UPI003F8CF1FC